MRHAFTTLAAAAAMVGGLSVAQAAQSVSAADRRFVASVSQGGMFEVQAGQLAAEQGSAQDIKDQGTTEAHDHKLVGETLTSVATAAGISFPSALTATFQQRLESLKSLSGAAFDAAYLSDMKTIHDKDGAAFAQESQSGTNPQLRQFAAATHRIVLMHIGELRAVPASE
jgi:putative membrane protein